jgi:hypothetical protein
MYTQQAMDGPILCTLERQCCRFLNFAVRESKKIVQLDVTGQPEALAIIEDLFG